ncbi:hypothetical protein HDU90_003562 [Geranomyces variabilis]|nr:hypothetical protein HDU90_003562 [Geranomyces variabilis]
MHVSSKQFLQSFHYEAPKFWHDMAPKFALTMVNDEVTVYVVSHYEKMFLAYRAGALPIITNIPSGALAVETLSNHLEPWRSFRNRLRKVESKMLDHCRKTSPTAGTVQFPSWMNKDD